MSHLPSPDDIGREVVRNGLTKSKDRKFERQIIKELTTLRLCNTDNPDLNKQFTIEEVKIGLNQLKLEKSPDPDSIHCEFLVNLGKNVITRLTRFINRCFHNNRIPKMWRRASVIALLKQGKLHTSPKSYRPISLLCTTFKLKERYPKPKQPYSLKILTSRAGRASQRAIYSGPNCLSCAEHRTSVR